MFPMNFNQVVNHNKAFYDAFIDLKLTGWNTYSKALNAYTMNFFREQLTAADTAVETFSKFMKGDVYGK